MKNDIAEFGIILISTLFVIAVFISVTPLFQNDGAIKKEILDYLSNIC